MSKAKRALVPDLMNNHKGFSLAAVSVVQRLVEAGLAQCVLGNHDLNILLGEEKFDNNWFYGRAFRHDGQIVPQTLVQDERPDLRIVHACWKVEMVELARQAIDVLQLYHHYVRLIGAEISTKGLDAIDRGLSLQNRNPVKVLTSGMERRVAVPFEASGKVRHEERVPWWNEYADPQYCVFGHYAAFPGEPHGHGRAIGIDYAVAKRHRERLEPEFKREFRGKLAAFRYPEKLIVFDDGTTEHVV